ncbi:MAG: HD domain-containing protein [Oligoflexia bacterium]|nr:HD domain-containing protein [Oligoflexia bacterium]
MENKSPKQKHSQRYIIWPLENNTNSDSILIKDNASPTFSSQSLGGKAEGLFKLAKLGIKVPTFFVITSYAFDDFAKYINLFPESEKDESEKDEPEKDEPEKDEQITADIISSPFPQNIIEEISIALAQISPPYAVRSSATLEDSDEASYAGIYDSFLEQKGPEEVLTSIKRCWCSLFTGRALSYKKKINCQKSQTSQISQTSQPSQKNIQYSKMNVIVQEMVKTKFSGVMFTINPVTKDRAKIVIEYVYADNDGVTEGTKNPGFIEMDKISGQVEKLIPFNYKEIEIYLEEKIIYNLFAYAIKLEKAFDTYLDIEWAVEYLEQKEKDPKIFLLQCRPETTESKKSKVSAEAKKSVVENIADFAFKINIQLNKNCNDKSDQYAKILEYAISCCRDENDQTHLLSAREMAFKILRSVPGEEDVVIPAIILHNIGRKNFDIEEEKINPGPGIYKNNTIRNERNRLHEIEGAKMAQEFLTKINYPPNKTAEIVKTIDGHDSRQEALSINDSIVLDADKLSRYTPECFSMFCNKFNINENDFLQFLEKYSSIWFFNQISVVLAREYLHKRKK